MAQLYYEFGLNQEEISRELGVSRPQVSRLLARARSEGFVRVEVRNPQSRAGELAARLIPALGLKDAVVVPAVSTGHALRSRAIGIAGARYLEAHLPRGARVGMGRGETAYHLVHALAPVAGKLQVVPLNGGLGEADAYYQSNELARVAAERLGGECHFLYCPAVADSGELRTAFLSDSGVAQAVALWDELDWAVVGIGSVDTPHNPAFGEYVRSTLLEGSGEPAGDVCLHFLDPAGRHCPTWRDPLLIGISLEQLRRTSDVLAVAGGPYKVAAILGAVRAGVVKRLVTDEQTAEGLLERARQGPALDAAG